MTAIPSPASVLPALATPEIIFNVLSPSNGKSVLVLLSLGCISLGAVLMELFNYLDYDVQLVRKPGWTQPAKLASRTAYLTCRILPIISISSWILFISLKGADCLAWSRVNSTLGMILFDAVMLIFAQRTMALYSWKRTIVLPLTIFYVVFLICSAIAVPFWMTGFTIPGTEFCAFDTRRHDVRTMVTNNIHKGVSMGLDITLLLLTLHRLLDGGLSSFRSGHERQGQQPDWYEQSISVLLVRQGFHFYILQLASDVFLLGAWWIFKDVAYQGLGGPVALCVPPIAAAAAFRNVGKMAFRTLEGKAVKVNEIVESTGPKSTARPSLQLTCPTVSSKSRPNTTVQVDGESSSSVLLGRSKLDTWGFKNGIFNRSDHDQTDIEKQGILVTVRKFSDTVDAENGFNLDSRNGPSGNADMIAMQQLQSNASLRSNKSKSSTEEFQSDVFELGFESVQRPALYRPPTPRRASTEVSMKSTSS